MAKILKFKRKLSYYLNLIDKRKKEQDIWGVLEATKSAMSSTKSKQKQNGLNLLLGQAFFDAKQFSQSNFYFFKALNSPNLKASAFFGIGRNCIFLNRFNLALDYFSLCLDFDFFGIFAEPVLEWTNFVKTKMDSPEFENQNLQNTAKILMFEKNFLEAKQILQTLKSDTTTLELLCTTCFFENDFFSAKKHSHELVLKNPENVTANIILFEIHKKQANTASMQKVLKKLENSKTENPKNLEKLGLFFSAQKNFVVAKKFFEKLVKIDEFTPKNHLFLALVYQNLQDSQNALFCISKAKWLDFENPIYDFFVDLFKSGFQNFSVSKNLPTSVEKQKLENLFEVFFCGKFCQELNKSHTLIFDVEWAFSLNDFNVTNTASAALCFCKNQKAKNLTKKLLIYQMPAKQKFAIVKNALFSSNFFNINLVSNLKYSSFSVSKNELENLGKLKKGTCKAISFAECFFPENCLLLNIFKVAKKNKTNQFLVNMKSNTVACFLLFSWPQVFDCACKFFKVEKKQIENIFNSKKMLEKADEQN